VSSPALNLVILGHVDHGKSTLLGRLLFELDALPSGRLEALRDTAKNEGRSFEFAHVLDALEEEQRQGVTIEISQFQAKVGGKDFLFIDAPGHTEFLKNMISGASRADAALLLLDVKEGIQEQSKLHGILLQLLGIKQFVVLVNKMDLIEYEQESFEKIKTTYLDFFLQRNIGIPSKFIPISAKNGDLLTRPSKNMPWYTSSTVTETILSFRHQKFLSNQESLRLPIQDVYKFDDRRLIVGKIESGTIKVGDELAFWPANSKAKIKSIENWNGPLMAEAAQGESVSIILDRSVFVERGYVATHSAEAIALVDQLEGILFWLSKAEGKKGGLYQLKIATEQTDIVLKSFKQVFGSSNLNKSDSEHVRRYDVAEVILQLEKPLLIDRFDQCEPMGRFLLLQDGVICAAGIIKQVAQRLEETSSNKQSGGLVVWMTGLSGSGKSSICQELAQLLISKNRPVFHLDGDILRKGLCSDLGYTEKDRKENIRRAGEVAALIAKTGVIVLASFISPYRRDRNRVRVAAKNSRFFEVYVDCPIELCEKRDPKGLYKKARSGKLTDFTGITSPYEIPLKPELHLRSDNFTSQELAKQVENFIDS